MKLEEMLQLWCVGNLEKALPHQPLLPPFLVLTAQESSVYRLVSLAICALTDTFLNDKVDQMVLIDYEKKNVSLSLSSNGLLLLACNYSSLPLDHSVERKDGLKGTNL